MMYKIIQAYNYREKGEQNSTGKLLLNYSGNDVQIIQA